MEESTGQNCARSEASEDGLTPLSYTTAVRKCESPNPVLMDGGCGFS